VTFPQDQWSADRRALITNSGCVRRHCFRSCRNWLENCATNPNL